MIIIWIFSIIISNSLPDNKCRSVAESLNAHKDYYNAVTEYERFLFHDSDTITTDSIKDNIRIKLAESYYQTDEFSRADKIVNSLIEGRSHLAQNAQLLRAQFYIRAKQYFRAKIELSDLLLFSPNQTAQNRVNQLFGYIALQEKEFDEAVKYFNSAQDTFLINMTNRIIQAPKKNPVLSQIMSSVIPGSGEIYAGKYGWGILSLLVNAATVYGTVNCYKKKQYLDATLIFTMLFTRFYSGSVNNARDFALEYNEKIYQSKIKQVERYFYFGDLP
jgi:tetratricopeptide (TPR) repeat protein